MLYPCAKVTSKSAPVNSGKTAWKISVEFGGVSNFPDFKLPRIFVPLRGENIESSENNRGGIRVTSH